ncbi:Cation/H+ exchanger [Corchorus capsularis]|uniref:Cation/H+ exchanger n=1 Tax=Corchorus capsularis TaxID=210143 RepID=A0A1R3ISA4_COCAP|nr:Cation/H+ exchanger [Corchorus capsularis]
MVVLFLAVIVSGLFGHIVGLHFSLGPLLFGLVIPSGPPLGSAIIEKLDVITDWVLMPLYFLRFGLTVDIFAIGIQTFYRVQFITLIAAVGKFLGAFLCGLFYQMQLIDAICLGFVVNFQGILELGLYKILSDESFSAMCISLLIVTGATTPIVRYFGDSSRRYKFYHGRTVTHSSPNSELRILVCIHDEEHVPSAINLLGALNPSKQSPIGVYMLHQIELTGSNAIPLLIPHKLTKKLSSRDSGHVINAFKNFAKDYEGLVSVFPFIALSPPQTMHNDVCSVALEKGTSLIVIPYYKRYHVNGETQSTRKALRIANQNVLDKAPCSVAILVDRGPFESPRALWTWTSYAVAVIFLGGADDREALAVGVRMAELPYINLTLIRILHDGECPAAHSDGNILDNEVLHDFRANISGNHRAMYKEELVTGGPGTATVLRSLENQYELVVVGRRYDRLSPILSGLAEWNENEELGVIGDVLASSDFLGNTTILVVQQHTDHMLNEIENILS